VASEPVVLEPHAGVGVPIVPWYVGRSPETQGEPRILYTLDEGSWTPLVRRQAAVMVIVVVVASSAPSVVMVACAVAAMIVYTPGPSKSPNGVPCITVRPEPVLDCRRYRPAPFPCGHGAERVAGLGSVRMVLPLIHAPTAGGKWSSLLVVLPLLRAAPSIDGILTFLQKSLPPDSHAATWLQRRGSAMPA
jgi:hypothetical protein